MKPEMEEAEQETLYNDFTVIQSLLALSPYRFFFISESIKKKERKTKQKQNKNKQKKTEKTTTAVSLDIQDPNT